MHMLSNKHSLIKTPALTYAHKCESASATTPLAQQQDLFPICSRSYNCPNNAFPECQTLPFAGTEVSLPFLRLQMPPPCAHCSLNATRWSLFAERVGLNFWCWLMFKCTIFGFWAFSPPPIAAVSQEASSEQRAWLSVEGDLLQAQPCQLWGTEVWPLRCLTSPVASGPASQLHNTAYLEQWHVLNKRPKADRAQNSLYWWARHY